ncbi:MAG: Flp pilus assembly protein CpaB, partial [Planctomycetaceae bacterium]
MKMKSVVLLVVALGCGLVAMLGVQQVMSSSPEVEPKPVDEVKVLVATQRIEPFSSMDDSNTGFKTIPKSVVPEGAVLSRSEYADKKLRYGASKGDIITAEKLIDKNYSASNEIPPGMRVVTVKVNQTKIHSGLLRPGDNVDVVLTYKAVKTGRRPVQRTV